MQLAVLTSSSSKHSGTRLKLQVAGAVQVMPWCHSGHLTAGLTSPCVIPLVWQVEMTFRHSYSTAAVWRSEKGPRSCRWAQNGSAQSPVLPWPEMGFLWQSQETVLHGTAAGYSPVMELPTCLGHLQRLLAAAILMPSPPAALQEPKTSLGLPPCWPAWEAAPQQGTFRQAY